MQTMVDLKISETDAVTASEAGVTSIEHWYGVPDAARVYCDQVKDCQGILPLSGSVYVIGNGPKGVALYRLQD